MPSTKKDKRSGVAAAAGAAAPSLEKLAAVGELLNLFGAIKDSGESAIKILAYNLVLARAIKIVKGAPVAACPQDCWDALKTDRYIYVPPASKLARPTQVNLHRSGVEILGCVLRDTDLLRDQVKKIPLSDRRHGDYQVALSATLRLVENFKELIEEEEIPRE
jgi:hypothetical protein